MMTSDRKRRLAQTAFFGALLGLYFSQYQPLWGTPQQRKAEPWSMTRKTLGGTHVMLFAGLGLVVGAVIIKVRNE